MLYNKVNYTTEISYLNNVFIYEYDISKANINVLFTKGVIDETTYNELFNSERMVRQVYVGKLCKDIKINNILKEGIIEAKKMLFEANNIQDNEVLSIKNDAVFIINRQLKITSFGLINFKMKNVYTSFYKLNNLEIYYYYNNVTQAEHIDIKGISDNKVARHENHFLQVIKDILYSIQINGPELTIKMIKDIYNEYITLNMPIGCYRSFDMNSEYHFKFISNTGVGYSTQFADESQKSMIDITTNLSIIMELQRIVISMFFTKNK